MLRKVLKISAHPRMLLRSVLALDDSPHAIALGVAVGVFFGLTPTVGIQTVLILAIVFLTRKVCYFNGAAAMAATYVSNPFTMVPMYYFWYRLGTRFVPSTASLEQVKSLLQVDGFLQWCEKLCTVGVDVGAPMFVGALLTAPFGALLAYPACYWLLKWVRRDPGQNSPTDGSGSAGGDATACGGSATDSESDSQTASDECESSESVKSPCLAV
jgi:uncharacterized protein (DUF2062 family)